MGASSGKIDSVIYCGPECEKQKEIDTLKTKYYDLLNEKKELPEKVEEARFKYYMLKDGPEWYEQQQHKTSESSSTSKYNEMKNNLNKIKYKYDTVYKLVTTQDKLIDKQNKNILNKNNSIKLNESILENTKNLYSTQNRKIEHINNNNKLYEIGIYQYTLNLCFLILTLFISVYMLFSLQLDDSTKYKLGVYIYITIILTYIYLLGIIPIYKNNIYKNKYWLIPFVFIGLGVILERGYHFINTI